MFYSTAARDTPRLNPAPHASQVGTGKAFGEIIVQKLHEIPDLALLDGDLASSLGVTAVSQHARFYQVRGFRFAFHAAAASAVTPMQMGVSEQDMVSFAAGLAISGMLPVVHTCADPPG
jgi:transketolase C-terminal domain/subunit